MSSTNDKNQVPTSIRIDLDLMVSFLGLFSYIAALLGLVIFIPYASFEGVRILESRVLCGASLLVASVLVYMCSQIMGRNRYKQLIVLSVIGAVAFVAGIAGIILEFDAKVIAGCMVIASVGAVAQGGVLFLQLCRFRGRSLIIIVTFGILLGTSLCLGSCLLNKSEAFIVFALSAAISSVCSVLFVWMKPESFIVKVKSKDSDKRSKIQSSSAIMLCVTFFELGFVISASTQAAALTYCLGTAIITAAVLVIDSLTKHLITERSLTPLTPPLTLFAFVLLFLSDAQNETIALCIITAIFTTYLAFGWVALAKHVRMCGLAPLRTYGKARYIDYGGLTLGILAGDAMRLLSFEQNQILVFGIAVALCGMAFLVHKPRFPEPGIKTDHDSLTEDDGTTRKLRCHTLGEQYDLSDRQQEVLYLMAQGRNARYIETTLVISLSTVQTHIRNIYRKLGIHSRQELLDLIESTKLYGEE